MSNESKRYHVVDALRGFAIVSIMLLHNIEHFDMYYTPQGLPQWLTAIDKVVWDSMFFLFGGKSYAIFALLFGLTFFIQMHNTEKRGHDFRARFAWRLALLFLFGIINAAFFQGDILMYYAVVGLFLIPIAKLSDKTVLFIAIILILQPIEMVRMLAAIQNPGLPVHDPRSWAYFGNMPEYIPGSSLFATMKGNLTNGRIAVTLWNWENGRFVHMLALFMLGMLAGRKKLFAWNEKTRRFWSGTLIIAAIAFIPLYAIKINSGPLIESDAIRHSFNIIETSWTNLSFMLVLVSGFTLLFHTKAFRKPLNILSPIGKMSLTNYVLQSILGSFIYYGYGLGLYRHTSPAMALVIGIVLAIIMGYFCTWWTKRYRRGPLETIWHQLTWLPGNKQ
ncbi:MAG TPA: DUF418 domain-containing protein [Bacteroidales bacterium]|nr:DUF418 domain-containing protein [Bacteroidales bacterium]